MDPTISFEIIKIENVTMKRELREELEMLKQKKIAVNEYKHLFWKWSYILVHTQMWEWWITGYM